METDSKQLSCREEVTAYTEAVHRLRDSGRFIDSRRSRGIVPAPELDMVTPNQRVEHYMQKLRGYLMEDEKMQQKYNEAAKKIQAQFRHFVWRKILKSMKNRARFHLRHQMEEEHENFISLLVRTMHRATSRTLALQLCKADQLSESGARGLDSMQTALKLPGKRRSIAPLMPSFAREGRGASVLQVAQQVSGTGLSKDPRQSLHLKQLEDQVAEVTPVLQHIAHGCTTPSRDGNRSSGYRDETEKYYMREEIESLNYKMDHITESLGVLAREVAQTKSALLYSCTYNQSHRSGTLPGFR